jgi:hypothetical protein
LSTKKQFIFSIFFEPTYVFNSAFNLDHDDLLQFYAIFLNLSAKTLQVLAEGILFMSTSRREKDASR